MKRTAAAAAGAALARARGAVATEAPGRPRAPFKTLYSNDTTNILSCVSPYHQKGDPLTDERIRASVDEAKGVDVHMLQPGLGWIAWWKSDVAPGDEHYRWLEREFGVKPNSFGKYILAAGDVVRAFVDGCRAAGVAPFISYRLNDGHHVRDLEKALAEGRRSPSMSRFYWENYRKY
ncbi:MAG: hypothetical protein NTW86_24935, partial [Candidatus Sumerlaeota bacterium]|nr:hypothetical protein [Candidatus Sumerlaeota bacterium]